MTADCRTADYRSTLFLPRSDFPLRAGLPQREPEILARWAETNTLKQLREAAAGREKYILHDGPSYANGHLHMGHALNKVLEDGIDLAELAITSDLDLVPEAPPAEAVTLEDVAGVGAVVRPAEGGKCHRCWRILPEVGCSAEAPGTRGRGADAVAQLGTNSH